MNYRIQHLLLFLFLSTLAFSQNKKFTYTQFDVTVALTGNPNRDEVDPYTNKKQSFLYRTELDQNLVAGFIIISGLQ